MIEIKVPDVKLEIISEENPILTFKEFITDLSCFKCIVFLDGTCSVCLGNLPAINNYLESFSTLEFIYVLNITNVKTFKAFCLIHNLNIQAIYDSESHIQTLNNLHNINFLLLSPENKILLKGNPLTERKVDKEYRKLLK